MPKNEGSPPPSLEDLDARIRRAQGEVEQPSAKAGDRGGKQGIGFAFRLGMDLVAGVVVGTVIGLLLDGWLDTKPWFLVVFFFLGAGAGFMNVYRAVKNLGYGAGYRPNKPQGGADDQQGTNESDGKR
ncbi:MAG: AtpZ/AtpI family protein [Alphaproteobacteria bacterium]